MEIKDTVVIVTGASSGIGKATAELFAKKGAKVALVARSEDSLKELEKKLPNSFAIVADMRKREDIKRMVEETIKHFGTVDILINNAGRGYDSFVENIDPDTYTELFQLNLLAPILAMQHVIPIMKKKKSGFIMNVSSGTALMNIPNLSAYSSLKKALAGISGTAQEELKDDGITVSVVYPFITRTNFAKNVMGKARTEDSYNNPDLPPADTPEHVAEKIIQAVEENQTEVFAHDWMKENK
ncbi:MAG: SDR family NAD(P)-dependent oxidoreductase [Candidatus Levyibacteriota bacterium]